MVGKFIVLEGIDGSGKDEVIPLIVAGLVSRGIRIRLTREPTYRIRSIIGEFGDNLALAYLFAADRIENSKTVRSFLDRGYRVIQSRHLLSSLVYQGNGPQDWENIYKLNEHAIEIVKPDYVFVLQVDPEVAYQRKMQDGLERFEKNLSKGQLERFKELSEKYVRASEWLASKGRNVHLIPPGEVNEISSKILSILLRYFTKTQTLLPRLPPGLLIES